MPRAAAIRRLPREREETSSSPTARRARLPLARRAEPEQEAIPAVPLVPVPAVVANAPARPSQLVPPRARVPPQFRVVQASGSDTSMRSAPQLSTASRDGVANVRAVPQANHRGSTSTRAVSSRVPRWPVPYVFAQQNAPTSNLVVTSANVPSQLAITARPRAGQPVPAARSVVANRRTPAVSASRQGASNSSSAARSQHPPAGAQPQRRSAVVATATQQRRPPVAAARRQHEPQAGATAAQRRVPVPGRSQTPIIANSVSTAPRPPHNPGRNMRPSVPAAVPGAAVAVVQQPNREVAADRPSDAINARGGQTEPLLEPVVASRTQVDQPAQEVRPSAVPVTRVLAFPTGRTFVLALEPLASGIIVRVNADCFARFMQHPTAVELMRCVISLARRRLGLDSAVRVKVFEIEAEAGTETLEFDEESVNHLPQTAQGFVDRYGPNRLLEIAVVNGPAVVPDSPMPNRDDTVIRSDDWGDCTICFEDLPYDPVGCLYCRQMIGCRFCVKQWIRTGREAAAAHPNNPEAGRNHRQCPLCRHEWDWEPEVTSMFMLRGGV